MAFPTDAIDEIRCPEKSIFLSQFRWNTASHVSFEFHSYKATEAKKFQALQMLCFRSPKALPRLLP
jgi:hypothetical protein